MSSTHFLLRSAAALTALAFHVAPVHAQPGPAFDHLKCYVIRDTNVGQSYTLDLLPEQSQFLAETGCTMRAIARWLCIDVVKTNVSPPPAGPEVPATDARDYLCYKLKCPKVSMTLEVRDQFGTRDVLVKKPDRLCVPAEKVVPPTPTPASTPSTDSTALTPSPTPTPTPIPSECVGFPFCQCADVLPQQGCQFGLCGGVPGQCVQVGGQCVCAPTPTPTP
jgi:hypothetical protein